ncbi:Heptahelical transmembrane protein 2 [Capsicum annuum]|nr:Heptahelical transmembrane protein 2 [Capsicum annuum]
MGGPISFEQNELYSRTNENCLSAYEIIRIIPRFAEVDVEGRHLSVFLEDSRLICVTNRAIHMRMYEFEQRWIRLGVNKQAWVRVTAEMVRIGGWIVHRFLMGLNRILLLRILLFGSVLMDLGFCILVVVVENVVDIVCWWKGRYGCKRFWVRHLGGFVIFVTLMIMSLMEKTTMENLFANIFRRTSNGEWMNIKNNGSAESFSEVTGSCLENSLWQKCKDSYARQITNPSFLDINGDGYEVAIWPWFVFLGGAMSCLISSTLSHLFACHSLRYNLFFWRLDYAGIALMIVCSFFCPIYYIFCDQPYWCIFYLSTITLFGILAIITLLSPALFSGRFRSFRVTLFLAMGFSGLIPATHALSLNYGHPQVLVALSYEIIMGVLYAIGAVFYMTRFPERCKPGAFDLVGHSHQIFHVLVVAAALAHCVASLVIMDWRRGWPTALR